MATALTSPLSSTQPRSGTFQSLFDSFVNETLTSQRASNWRPLVDLVEEDHTYSLAIDLPGFRDEDVEVQLEDRVLTVRAERSVDIRDGAQYRLSERPQGRSERSFRLPSSVDPAAIAATLELGVLHLSLPKREETRSRTIQIQGAGS